MGSNRKSIKRSYFDMQFVITCISTTLVLTLVGIVLVFSLSAHSLSKYVKENIGFSVVLSEDATGKSAEEVIKELKKKPYVSTLQYISKEEALKEYVSSGEVSPEEFLGYNPFSASIEVKLNHEYAHVDSLKKISDEIKQKNTIKEVEYRSSLIEDVNRNASRFNVAMLIIVVLMSVISVSLINNTIRLSVYSKRFLINTMQLVGATNGFIRRPFVAKIVLCGLISAVLSIALLGGGVYWLIDNYPQLTTVLTVEILVISAVGIIAFGLLMSWLCAHLAVNRFLRLNSSEIHYV